MFESDSSFLGKVIETYATERLQYLVYLGLSLVIFIFTFVLVVSENQDFQRFLGNLNPITAYLTAIILGFILLSFMLTKKWFAIFESGNFKGQLPFFGLAALLGAVMILVDSRIMFSADMNIPFPRSLLFYPAIAFFVEILFHVLSLTLISVTLNAILKNTDIDKIIWFSIFMIAAAEPLYQTMNMVSEKQFPLWAVVYVGIHIFIINLLQLFLFKKYDFIAMYSFRIVYYLIWHIGWGYLRLSLLF